MKFQSFELNNHILTVTLSNLLKSRGLDDHGFLQRKHRKIILQSKTFRNERVRSSRIKQNHCRYCVDRKRTEYDIRSILCLLLSHVVQMTLPVVVVGIEIVSLGR